MTCHFLAKIRQEDHEVLFAPLSPEHKLSGQFVSHLSKLNLALVLIISNLFLFFFLAVSTNFVSENTLFHFIPTGTELTSDIAVKQSFILSKFGSSFAHQASRYSNFQGNQPSGSREEAFLRFLPYLGMVAILVM